MNNEIYISNADLQKALKDIDKYGEKVKQGVKDEIARTAFGISLKAKQNLKDNRSYKTGALSATLTPHLEPLKFAAKVGSALKYAAYVEFGTPPHIIQVKTKKVLARYTGTTRGKAGFEIFGKKVNHPGSPAKPYLFPAAERERPRFIENIKKILSGSK